MMNTVKEKWPEIIEHLRVEHELSNVSFNTWIQPLKVYDVVDNTVFILVNMNASVEYIEKKYQLPLKVCIAEITGTEYEVVFISEDDDRLNEIQNMAIEANQKKKSKSAAEKAGLNPKYTFDTFVVGSNNRFAQSASLAVAESPGNTYNPLFIYGDSGLGKTHLLYAIANALRKKRPEARIVYVKGDDFTNELIASIRENRNAEFREKYRQTDILLMDDIQFIAGKIQTQEEFFHTFNTLYESGRQIVLTSDRPPKEITQLEDRLRTRFEWGLMVDVAPPDFETRFAIVQNKAAMLGVKLPNEVTDYIAENITSNVRQIEGTLNKILAYRDLLDDQVNEETVSRAIRDMLKKSNDFAPTPAIIVGYICSYFHVDEETLRGQSRSRDVVAARQIAMYLIRRMTSMSLNDIGKEFGDRDHSTILHSLDKVESTMRSDPAFAEKVKEITTNINSKK